MGPATSRTYSVWTTPSPFEIRVNQPGAAELVYPATSGRTNDRMSFPLPLDIPSMTEVNRFFSVYNNNTQLAQLRLSRNANETMFGRGANVISHEDDFNPEDMLACTPETAATFNGGAVVLTNSANYLPLISKDSIASAWAIRLADGEAFPSSAPLPTTLGGIQALLNGVPAALSYVSKTQVNAIVPPNLGSRLQNSSRIDGKVVEVRVVGSDGLRAIGSVATAVTSPGLFAGYRLGDYAVVFGTGFRYFRDDPCYSDARVTFNGTATALPTYVGAQGEMLGLDQVNVLIPESLRSAASVSVELSFNPSCAYAFGAARSNRITVPLR